MPGRPRSRYPQTVAITATSALAVHLAYYSDDVRSLTPILAPRGWDCQVSVGADGSTSIEVYPAGATSASKTAVAAQSESACQGCIYSLVCKLVPKAGRELGYGQPGLPCTVPRPASEKVTWINGSPTATGYVSDVIGFDDPAGVRGTGEPSGGSVPANGVVLYQWSHGGQDGASLETCALPAADHDLCTAVLNDFATQNWLMPG